MTMHYGYNGRGERVRPHQDCGTTRSVHVDLGQEGGEMPLVESMLVSALMIACPSAIRDNQGVSKIEGWNVRVAGGDRKLDYMEVFIGHPSRRRALRPIEENGSFVWSLGEDDVWVECRYRNSAVILFRSVGKVESCVFTRADPGRRIAAKGECNS
nr:STY0301 family protein [Lysobacter maris]